MLTLEKLKIYDRYEGDIDGWTRTRKNNDKSAMTDDDWFLIDELRQGLSLVSSGRVSAEFAASVESKLFSSTDSETTRQKLRKF